MRALGRVPKSQVLHGDVSLISQSRSERSCNDPQPFDHGPETTRLRQKRALESTRTNTQEGQVRALIEQDTPVKSIMKTRGHADERTFRR